MKKNITIFLILAGFAASCLNGMVQEEPNLTQEEIAEQAVKLGMTPEKFLQSRKLEQETRKRQAEKIAEEKETAHEEAMRNLEREEQDRKLAAQLQESDEKRAALPAPQSRTSRLYEGTKKLVSIPLDKVTNFIHRVTTPTIDKIIENTKNQLNKAFEPLINELKKEDRYNLEIKKIINDHVNMFMAPLRVGVGALERQVQARSSNLG